MDIHNLPPPPTDMPPPVPPTDTPSAPHVVRTSKGSIMIGTKNLAITYQGKQLDPNKYGKSYEKFATLLGNKQEQLSQLSDLRLIKGGIAGKNANGKYEKIKFDEQEFNQLKKIIKAERQQLRRQEGKKSVGIWEKFTDRIGGKEHRISLLERELKKLCGQNFVTPRESAVFANIASYAHISTDFKELLRYAQDEKNRLDLGIIKELSKEFIDKKDRFEQFLIGVVTQNSPPVKDAGKIVRAEVESFLNKIMTEAGLPPAPH